MWLIVAGFRPAENTAHHHCSFSSTTHLCGQGPKPRAVWQVGRAGDDKFLGSGGRCFEKHRLGENVDGRLIVVATEPTDADRQRRAGIRCLCRRGRTSHQKPTYKWPGRVSSEGRVGRTEGHTCLLVRGRCAADGTGRTFIFQERPPPTKAHTHAPGGSLRSSRQCCSSLSKERMTMPKQSRCQEGCWWQTRTPPQAQNSLFLR